MNEKRKLMVINGTPAHILRMFLSRISFFFSFFWHSYSISSHLPLMLSNSLLLQVFSVYIAIRPPVFMLHLTQHHPPNPPTPTRLPLHPTYIYVFTYT